MKIFITLNKKIIPIIFWILVWQILYLRIDSEILMVSPFDVFFNLVDKIFLLEFWKIVFLSVQRIIKGFFISIFWGVILGYVCYKVKYFYYLLNPVFSILKTVPVASFIILALVWVKSDTIPIVMSFIMVMPIIFTEIYVGLSNVDVNLIEMGKVFKLTKYKLIKNIFVPSIVPHVSIALKNGIGLAWKSGIAAEILSSPKFAIGRKIYDSKIYIDTLELFTWTIVVIILSLFFESLMIKLLNKFQKYNKVSEV